MDVNIMCKTIKHLKIKISKKSIGKLKWNSKNIQIIQKKAGKKKWRNKTGKIDRKQIIK